MIGKRNLIVMSAGVLLVSGAASGQTSGRGPAADDPPDLAAQSSIDFTWTSGVEYQASTDIGSNGDVNVLRVSTGLGVRVDLTSDLNMLVSVGLGLDDYDFGGSSGLGGLNPWEDIYTINAAVIFDLTLNNDWAVFGGPLMQIASEGSLSGSDAWIGGGMVGARYVVSPDLTLGLGLGVVSQIEDDARFFPVLQVNWELTDTLKIANASGRAGGGTGVELVYDAGRGFELALGAGYEFRRFRLDDSGVAPDGVGEETRTVGWGRLSYQALPNVRADFLVGFALDGEVRLEDEDGHSIVSEDYEDPSFVIAAALQIRF